MADNLYDRLKNYEPMNWKNYPDKSTPITAERLNYMDAQIKRSADITQHFTIVDDTLCVIIEEEEESNG